MPVRYAPAIPLPPKEFIEPIPDRSFIFWLFRNRCIMCNHPATDVNEIVPRSRSKKSILNWENRVTLCQNCHNEYHKNGVNAKTIEHMQQKRYDFLMANGREEYANYKPLEVLIV